MPRRLPPQQHTTMRKRRIESIIGRTILETERDKTFRLQARIRRRLEVLGKKDKEIREGQKRAVVFGTAARDVLHQNGIVGKRRKKIALILFEIETAKMMILVEKQFEKMSLAAGILQKRCNAG